MLLALLVVVRLLLPPVLSEYVQAQLGEVPGYEARLGSIDVRLWAGGYEIEQLVLVKKDDAPLPGEDGQERTAALPFFTAAAVDLGLSWRQLLLGELQGRVAVRQPVIVVVQPPEEPAEELKPWQERLQELHPFTLERFSVLDGQLRYRTLVDEVPFEFFVDDLYLEVRNLTNVPEEGLLPTTVLVAGRPEGQGELEAVMRLDPESDPLRFELRVEIRDVPLPALNRLLREFAGVDAHGGRIDLYCEVAALQGYVEGYARTVLEDVALATWGEVETPGDALDAFWDALVGAAAEVLENQPYDRLATRVPISGTLDELGTELGPIVRRLLRNAFVEPLRPGLEGSVDLRRVAEETPASLEEAARENLAGEDEAGDEPGRDAAAGADTPDATGAEDAPAPGGAEGGSGAPPPEGAEGGSGTPPPQGAGGAAPRTGRALAAEGPA